MLDLLVPILLSGAAVAANSTSSVVCVAGQCLQGFSNTTLGVTLTSDDSSTSLRLLPGSYSDSTSPQLLHDLLTSPSASLSASVGFSDSSTLNLPLNVGIDTGFIIYADSLYSGSASHAGLPTEPISNTSTSFSASSFALSSSVWAALSIGNTDRVIVWESVPDVSQLGSLSGDLSLLDLQSSQCSPSCSSNGVCSTSGTCTCAEGFTGSSCETCKSGFFGSTCQACPSGCSDCDDGMTGSGRCLKLEILNAPSTCKCLNGECSSDGSCTCNPGWTTASNGTLCAACSDGFFLTSTGDCKICSIGCTDCADGTGTCLTCDSGFTLNANDKTKCTARSTTSSSGATCPDGSFSDGKSATCTACDPSCSTCNGSTSNDCILCASGTYLFNGGCVSADASGVCEGSSLIADNNKNECDTCGAKCTSCAISDFTAASTVDQLKCTDCLPGSFLSNGACIDACPSGSFVNPSDNKTCSACDSSCSSCTESATFCLTCPGNQLASDGTCVSSCPFGTFQDTDVCLTCHPDCATCSGGTFNECSTCPPDRPVLNNGRCLPTCSSSQFFDTTANACQSCNSGCSTCFGDGADQCLSCSSSTRLRGGSCVAANCTDNTSIVPGLGVCLSELVEVPEPSETSSSAPLPSITGVSDPTVVTTGGATKLQWWQILLMALGCAFIFLLVLMLWRRRARKQRAKRTAMFATAKNLPHRHSWRWRLVRFGEKLFGHKRSQRAYPDQESEEIKLMRLKNAEEARIPIVRRVSDGQTIEKIYGSYLRDDISRAPSKHVHHHHVHTTQDGLLAPAVPDNASVYSGLSIYSQVTGVPRKTPDVRQKDLMSRFSGSTFSAPELLPPPPRTDAQAYAHAVRSDSPTPQGGYWMQPNPTGGSRNPFRQ